MGFAQGKTMLWRRSDLDAAGGIWALAREPAEDAAATKVVRAAGLRVRLRRRRLPAAAGRQVGAQVWARQVRWARLRRGTFPGYFALEIFSGLLAPLAALVLAACVLDYDAVPFAAAYAGLWFAAEALLATAAGLAVLLARAADVPAAGAAAAGAVDAGLVRKFLELARQRHDRCPRHRMDGAGFALLTNEPIFAPTGTPRIANARVPPL